ncbi:MAG: hypothetical protein JXR91_08790, partial [Deltaproteobacteria bacterium]|nr:hypothetical protein [Deltaproteobacteria bacterium]
MKQLSNFIKIGIMASLFTACGSSGTTANKANISADQVQTIILSDLKTKAKPAPAMPGINVPSIKVDTVGYPIGWKKTVIFNIDPKGAVVRNAAGQDILGITDDTVTNYGVD